MPLFLEPDKTFPVVLDVDTDKPIATQPAFLVSSQSMRGQQRIGEVLDLWTESELSVSELFAETVSVLRDVITGWRNMGGREFNADDFAEILTYQEARELLRKVMYNQHITIDEKKS